MSSRSTTKRRSGFLAPTSGPRQRRLRGGAAVLRNIPRNLDATVHAEVYTKRGIQADGANSAPSSRRSRSPRGRVPAERGRLAEQDRYFLGLGHDRASGAPSAGDQRQKVGKAILPRPVDRSAVTSQTNLPRGHDPRPADEVLVVSRPGAGIPDAGGFPNRKCRCPIPYASSAAVGDGPRQTVGHRPASLRRVRNSRSATGERAARDHYRPSRLPGRKRGYVGAKVGYHYALRDSERERAPTRTLRARWPIASVGLGPRLRSPDVSWGGGVPSRRSSRGSSPSRPFRDQSKRPVFTPAESRTSIRADLHGEPPRGRPDRSATQPGPDGAHHAADRVRTGLERVRAGPGPGFTQAPRGNARERRRPTLRPRHRALRRGPATAKLRFDTTLAVSRRVSRDRRPLKWRHTSRSRQRHQRRLRYAAARSTEQQPIARASPDRRLTQWRSPAHQRLARWN